MFEWPSFCWHSERFLFNFLSRNNRKNPLCKLEMLYTRLTEIFKWEICIPRPSLRGCCQIDLDRCPSDPGHLGTQNGYQAPVSKRARFSRTSRRENYCFFKMLWNPERWPVNGRLAVATNFQLEQLSINVASINLRFHRFKLETSLSALSTCSKFACLFKLQFKGKAHRPESQIRKARAKMYEKILFWFYTIRMDHCIFVSLDMVFTLSQ